MTEAILTYIELVAAANSGDRQARVELAIVERRMLTEGGPPFPTEAGNPFGETSPESGRRTGS